jgi:hypothetical protein
MTDAERQLYEQLNSWDNLDTATGSGSAKGVGASLKNITGNPVFKHQFNLNFKTYYIKVATPATLISAAALASTSKVDQPLIIFGNSDFAGGYVKSRSFVNKNDSVWVPNLFGILGRDLIKTSLPSGFQNLANIGDMVFYAIDSTGVDARLIIISCPQVAYGTLLDALSSDMFMLNMIRYVVDDTQTSQLRQQLQIVKQSIFGLTENNSIDPQTYITGGTYNKNIADIPLEIGIDKNKSIATYVNYDVVDFGFTITVMATKKLTA